MGAFPDSGSWQDEAAARVSETAMGPFPTPSPLSDAVETVFLSQATHHTHTGGQGSPTVPGSRLPSVPHQAAHFARVSVCTGVGVARGGVWQGTGHHPNVDACDGLEASCAFLWSSSAR